jgi:hypothetical protein
MYDTGNWMLTETYPHKENLYGVLYGLILKKRENYAKQRKALKKY